MWWGDRDGGVDDRKLVVMVVEIVVLKMSQQSPDALLLVLPRTHKHINTHNMNGLVQSNC